MSDQVYRLPVWETIVAAWQTTHGVKKTIWAALLIIVLIAAGFGVLSKVCEYFSVVLAAITDLTGQAIISILQLGILYLGIRRAQNQPINWRQIFDVFNIKLITNIAILYLLQFLLILLPLLIMGGGVWLAMNGFYDNNLLLMMVGAIIILMTLPIIFYLCIRIIFGVAFLMDKQASPIEAMKLSFRISRGNVWFMLGVIILEMMIFIISAIPFGIGLIWTIPFSYVLYGVMYRELLKHNSTGIA